MWRKMFGLMIKAALRPFTRRDQFGPEDGMVPIVIALALAGAGYLAIEVAQKQMSDSAQAEDRSVKQLYMQMANESALQQVSQLLGNFVILVDGTAKKFKPGSAIQGLQSGSGFQPSTATSRSWSLSNAGVISIYTCMRPKLTSTSMDTVFNNNDNASWYDNTTNCDANFQLVTTVTVNELLNANTVKFDTTNFDDEHQYAVVTANTVIQNPDKFSKGMNISKKARLKLADPTKVCLTDSQIGSEVCNVDHCKFMEPFKTTQGDVGYFKDGTFDLQPNGFYIEPTTFSPNAAAITLAKIHADDPDPVDLRNFLNSAYDPGRIHPFQNWQGIEGFYAKIPRVDFNPDGSISIDLTVDGHTTANTTTHTYVTTTSIGGSKKGKKNNWKNNKLAQFDGYLYKTNWASPAGSTAMNWTPGVSYDQLKVGLKGGCQRTLGTSLPDICTRVNLVYESWEYQYPRQRRCYYLGPPNYAEAGLYPWSVVAANQTLSSWVQVPFANVGRRKIQDNRTAYTDVFPHHDFGPKGEPEVLYTHDFSNIKTGDVLEEEVSSKQILDPNAGSGDGTTTTTAPDGTVTTVTVSTDAKGVTTTSTTVTDPTGKSKTTTSTSGPNYLTEYYRRTIASQFDVSCNLQSTNGTLVYDHDLTVCFYLAYYNIKNRLTCSRRIENYLCRNTNGCFAKGTPIMMGDGTYRNIEDLHAGDKVYNPASGTESKVAEVVVGDQKADMYRISFGGKTITATHNHPFMTSFGIKRSEELTLDDILLDKDYNPQKIEAITKIPKEDGGLVWNLLLEPPRDVASANVFQDHLFVANGTVSGDYFIQTTNDKNPKMKDFEEFGRFMLTRQIPGAGMSH